MTLDMYASVSALHGLGLDIEVVAPPLDRNIDTDTQARVTSALDQQVGRSDFTDWLFSPEYHPAGANWHGQRKRALALHMFYNRTISKLGEGIDSATFDEPLPGDTLTPREVVYAENADKPGKADHMLRATDAYFADVPLEDNRDEYGLASRDYLLGVVDGQAVGTRALAAKDIVQDHFVAQGRSEIVTASLGCGAADPVLQMMRSLDEEGLHISQADMVDMDPLALAVARNRARHFGVEDRLRIHRQNLFGKPITEYIAPGSVDAVDLIGVFEYFQKSVHGYRLAAHLLLKASELVRPGGLVIFGNMLDDRPQQQFFSKVWPKLQQRSVAQVVGLVNSAGFSSRDLTVRIPTEGVYAAYGLRVTEERAARGFTPSRVQQFLGKQVLKHL